MSKLDEYKKSNAEHAEIAGIIAALSEPGARSTFYSNTSYGVGHFQLNAKRKDGASMGSNHFAECFALAVGAHLPDLFAEAVKFSEADLAEKARAAQAEAIETLQNIKVEQTPDAAKKD